MGSHLAGPHSSLEQAPADSPQAGRVLLEIPHLLLCEWKRKPECTRRDLGIFSGWSSLVVVVVVGVASSPKAGGAASASFLGPHSPFS